MENWQLVLVTLSALLVGALIPLAIQLRSSLHRLEVDLHEMAGRLTPTLEDVRVTAHHLRLVADGLEGRERGVGELVESAGDLARTLDRLRHTTQVATAVAAAVAAGIRAFREPHTAPAGDGTTAWPSSDNDRQQGEPS